MRNIFLLICITVVTLTAMAQKPVLRIDDSIEVFSVVENYPEFPGGTEEMFQFFATNVKYPPEAIEKGIEGRVFVTFVVEKDGRISNIRVLRGIGGGCDEEAVRVVTCMPKWKPGEQRGGEKVRVQFNLPINFQLK